MGLFLSQSDMDLPFSVASLLVAHTHTSPIQTHICSHTHIHRVCSYIRTHHMLTHTPYIHTHILTDTPHSHTHHILSHTHTHTHPCRSHLTPSAHLVCSFLSFQCSLNHAPVEMSLFPTKQSQPRLLCTSSAQCLPQ